MAICVAYLTATVAPARAGSVDEHGRPVTTTSSSTMCLAAAAFGAGTALLVTSLLVEGEYEKVVGYEDRGDFQTPITISGGNDIDGLRVAGAAFLLLGCMLSLRPSSPTANDDPAPARVSSAKPDAGTDLVLEPIVLAGRAAGIGVGIGF